VLHLVCEFAFSGVVPGYVGHSENTLACGRRGIYSPFSLQVTAGQEVLQLLGIRPEKSPSRPLAALLEAGQQAQFREAPHRLRRSSLLRIDGKHPRRKQEDNHRKAPRIAGDQGMDPGEECETTGIRESARPSRSLRGRCVEIDPRQAERRQLARRPRRGNRPISAIQRVAHMVCTRLSTTTLGFSGDMDRRCAIRCNPAFT
jgi:hypothetical protein